MVGLFLLLGHHRRALNRVKKVVRIVCLGLAHFRLFRRALKLLELKIFFELLLQLLIRSFLGHSPGTPRLLLILWLAVRSWLLLLGLL